MNLRIKSQIDSLDSLFNNIGKIDDEEIKGHLAKYLCIKTSGLLENFIKSQIGDYVDICSSQPTAKFVKGKLKSFTNIDNKKLTGFLESFHQDWYETYNLSMNDKLKSALNSVISNRNNIAHGNPDSITFGNIKTYYIDIKEIIIILDGIIKK